VVPFDEVSMSPPVPTATKVLLTYFTPLIFLTIPEVLEVHVVPSDELRIVPLHIPMP
jgi:hypothetical protein